MQSAEGRVSIVQRTVELREQLRRRYRACRIELTLPLARIRKSANTADDPLLDISAEMKNQISDAVGSRVWPPPDLFVRELLNHGADSRRQLFPEIATRVRDECGSDVWHLRCLEVRPKPGE